MSGVRSIIIRFREAEEVAEKCVIITGGDFHPVQGVRPGDTLIACDRGYAHALASGLRPDLVIGDFDSYAGSVDAGIPVRRLPFEKDDTDTMSAVRWACAEGFEELELHCALGGRLDHTLANLQALVFAAQRGLRASIQSPDTVIRALHGGTLRIPRREGFSLSVFSVTDSCRVSIRGAKYALENALLTNAFPLGVSNEWAAPETEISAEDGTLLIVESCLR